VTTSWTIPIDHAAATGERGAKCFSALDLAVEKAVVFLPASAKELAPKSSCHHIQSH